MPAPWPADRIRPGAEEPTYPPPPAPQVTYSPRKAWDSYVSSTGRYVHRNLLVGSDGTYKVVATDHDAASNSNGGSVCIFNAGGWSDCVSKAGDRYQHHVRNTMTNEIPRPPLAKRPPRKRSPRPTKTAKYQPPAQKRTNDFGLTQPTAPRC